MRKLASIVTIATAEPIPETERLDVVTLVGKAWRIVTGRNEFRPGDRAVYFEIDSALPVDDERYAFLHDRCLRSWSDKHGNTLKQAVRIRTVKLRGVISQGLVMPIGAFPEAAEYEVGDDVTSVLRVEHFDEIQEQMRAALDTRTRSTGRREGNFPTFIPKTDEERIQNLADWPEKLRGVRWEVTEKNDGCVCGTTFIDTDQGKMKINHIVEHQLKVNILSYNEKENRCEYKPVVAWHRYPVRKPMVRVWVSRRADCSINPKTKGIKCTFDHLFFTDKGWIQAGDLRTGDTIYHFQKTTAPVVNEMLLGCLLGDSSVAFRHNGEDTPENKRVNSVWFNHCEEQLPYFNLKRNLLGNLFIDSGENESGYGSRMYHGHTVSNPYINDFVNTCCIVNGQKHITSEWMRRLTPVSLAFWYLDDGNLSCGEENAPQRPFAMIHTQRYSDEEVDMLVQMLDARFGITATKAKCNHTGRMMLRIGADSAEVLFSLIAPYVCDCMKYKLPRYFRNIPCVLESLPRIETDGILAGKVIGVAEYVPDSKHQSVFDLEVEDNHNYFANGVLIHNSSMTVFYAPSSRPDNPFGVCSRNFELKRDGENAWWQAAVKYELEAKLRAYGRDIAVQGELVGPGMNGNRDLYAEREFHVFRIWDIRNQCYIPTTERVELCKMLNIPHVKVIDSHKDVFGDLPTVDDVLLYAEGKTDRGNEREGLVFKEADVSNPRSFKAVSNRYLLKLI